MTVPCLSTARLELRPPTPADAAFITAAMQDRRVWEWLTVIPQPYAHADAMAFITDLAPEACWMITRDGRPLGVISIGAELGYWLIPEAWGQGIITEAGDAVIDWAFSDPARRVLDSGHFSANDRSRRALEKLGFVDIGAKTSCCKSDGRTGIPSRRMVLTRARWQDRRAFQLSTARLTLRGLTAQDAPDLARICGHPDVAPNLLAIPVGWSEDAAARLIAASRYRGRLPFRVAICKEGALIGTCGIGGLTVGEPPSLVYALDPAHAGQGLATEAMLAFIDEIDRRFALPRIDADHFADNPASGAVLTHLGFRRTGADLGSSAARARPHEIVLYQRATLRTDRLLLRPQRPSDAATLHRFMSVWDVTRQTGTWPWPPDPAFSAQKCQTFEGEGDIWAICRAGQMIGSVSITRKTGEAPSIGYHLDPAHHGRGLITEAARAAMAYAFRHYGWDQISASTWVDNPASQAVLAKLGFQRGGMGQGHATARRQKVDTYLYTCPRPADLTPLSVS